MYASVQHGGMSELREMKLADMEVIHVAQKLQQSARPSSTNEML